jgi:hypothetical protein
VLPQRVFLSDILQIMSWKKEKSTEEEKGRKNKLEVGEKKQ